MFFFAVVVVIFLLYGNRNSNAFIQNRYIVSSSSSSLQLQLQSPISLLSSPSQLKLSKTKTFIKSRFPLSINAISDSNQNNDNNNSVDEIKEPSAFDQVASKGLAGVLAIACAEAIFWALGMPLATLWVKFTTGEWIDLMTTEGQLQAAGFTFGYGGFATVILQYRVTLFAIPLVPIMESLVVEPGKKLFGEKFGEKKE